MQLHTLPFDLHLRAVTGGLTPLLPPQLAATEPLYFAKHLRSDGAPRVGSNPVRPRNLPTTFANSKYPFPKISASETYSLSKLLQYLSLALIFTAFLLLALTFHPGTRPARPDIHELDTFQPTTANISWDKKHDPVRWLKENSKNKYAVSRNLIPPLPSLGGSRRPRAALISLVRNSELPGMMQSMRQLEYRWNRKYKVCSLSTSPVVVLMDTSTPGYSSTMSLSRKSLRGERRTLLQQSAITP